jgi:hypothetical protein
VSLFDQQPPATYTIPRAVIEGDGFDQATSTPAAEPSTWPLGRGAGTWGLIAFGFFALWVSFLTWWYVRRVRRASISGHS